MQGSTSPSKNGLAPGWPIRNSQKTAWLPDPNRASRRVTADSTASSARSTPVARKRRNVKRVDNQTGATSRPTPDGRVFVRRALRAGPSSLRRDSLPGKQPLIRSRIACQRIAGSDSSSQATASTPSVCAVTLRSLLSPSCSYSKSYITSFAKSGLHCFTNSRC
jgi:hypothetical protein